MKLNDGCVSQCAFALECLSDLSPDLALFKEKLHDSFPREAGLLPSNIIRVLAYEHTHDLTVLSRFASDQDRGFLQCIGSCISKRLARNDKLDLRRQVR